MYTEMSMELVLSPELMLSTRFIERIIVILRWGFKSVLVF